LSQGGYELLLKKMMEEKLKERQEAAGDTEVPPPSPPQRHEKWKRARIKPPGEYTSEDTRVVAETIVSKCLSSSFQLVNIVDQNNDLKKSKKIFLKALRIQQKWSIYKQ